MGSIDRYIFRHTLGAFLLVLVSLTSLIWVTQALRDIDLMTSQGQSILVFIGITGLVIPQLVLVIAPVALVIAVAHVLNKLATNSEIIVMNAAGMSPWRLFRPFFFASSSSRCWSRSSAPMLSPKCLRELRRWATEVRADLVTNIVQPGRFITIETGPGVPPARTAGQRPAARHLPRRSPQPAGKDHRSSRRRAKSSKTNRAHSSSWSTAACSGTRRTQRDPNIVKFERYAFDLSQFSNPTQSKMLVGARTVSVGTRSRPPPTIPVSSRTPTASVAELHDRLIAPFYPIAFATIAFAWLGAPSTTRQEPHDGDGGDDPRGLRAAACGLCQRRYRHSSTPIALAGQYVVLAAMMWISLRAISRGSAIEPPAWLTDWITKRERAPVAPLCDVVSAARS